MPILDFRFNKINAVNNNKTIPKDGMKVDMKVNFTNVEELPKPENSPTSALKADFEFNLDYSKNGNVNLLGSVVYGAENEKIKKIINSWKKDKQLEKEVSTLIMNVILLRTNVKALTLSQDVNLPLHLRMPALAKD